VQKKLQQIVITLLDISERKKVEEALIESHEQLKQFASHINTLRDEEKVVLARELHDNVAQTLIAVKIDLGLLKQKFSTKDMNISLFEISDNIQNLYKLVDNTIKRVRKLITELWP
jgi:signal transduction histidine kinase